MKYTNKILGAIIVLLALTTAYFYDKPAEVITETIIEECEECPVCEPERITIIEEVEKIVVKQVIKEVPVDRVVITEVPIECPVCPVCEEEDLLRLKIDSLSILPEQDSVRFYVSTNIETNATLNVWTAYSGNRYDTGAMIDHTLEKDGLTKNTKYYYEIKLITPDGRFLKRFGDFFTSK